MLLFSLFFCTKKGLFCRICFCFLLFHEWPFWHKGPDFLSFFTTPGKYYMQLKYLKYKIVVKFCSMVGKLHFFLSIKHAHTLGGLTIKSTLVLFFSIFIFHLLKFPFFSSFCCKIYCRNLSWEAKLHKNKRIVSAKKILRIFRCQFHVVAKGSIIWRDREARPAHYVLKQVLRRHFFGNKIPQQTSTLKSSWSDFGSFSWTITIQMGVWK